MPDEQRFAALTALNRLYEEEPERLTDRQKKELAEFNLLYQDDPGYFQSQGAIRDALRWAGQVPLGFFESFTTVETHALPPRTSAERIGRSIGSTLGFLGMIPNPATLGTATAIKAGSVGAAKLALRKGAQATARVGAKAAGKQLTRREAGRAAGQAVERMIAGQTPQQVRDMALDQLKSRGYNLMPVRSVPIGLAQRAMGSKYGVRAGKAMSQIIGKLPYRVAGPVMHMGKHGIELGLASAIAGLGVNPFQWQERVDRTLPAFASGAVFGMGFGAIGNAGHVVGKFLERQMSAGNAQMMTRTFRALAGAGMQGGMAAGTGADTSELLYEYLVGAYFGWNTPSWKQARSRKKVQDVSREYIGGREPGKYATTPITEHMREKVSFEQRHEIDQIRKQDPELADMMWRDFQKQYNISHQAINEDLRKQGFDSRFNGFIRYNDANGNARKMAVTNTYPTDRAGRVLDVAKLVGKEAPESSVAALVSEQGGKRQYVLRDVDGFHRGEEAIKKGSITELDAFSGEQRVPINLLPTANARWEFANLRAAFHGYFAKMGFKSLARRDDFVAAVALRQAMHNHFVDRQQTVIPQEGLKILDKVVKGFDQLEQRVYTAFDEAYTGRRYDVHETLPKNARVIFEAVSGGDDPQMIKHRGMFQGIVDGKAEIIAQSVKPDGTTELHTFRVPKNQIKQVLPEEPAIENAMALKPQVEPREFLREEGVAEETINTMAKVDENFYFNKKLKLPEDTEVFFVPSKGTVAANKTMGEVKISSKLLLPYQAAWLKNMAETSPEFARNFQAWATELIGKPWVESSAEFNRMMHKVDQHRGGNLVLGLWRKLMWPETHHRDHLALLPQWELKEERYFGDWANRPTTHIKQAMNVLIDAHIQNNKDLQKGNDISHGLFMTFDLPAYLQKEGRLSSILGKSKFRSYFDRFREMLQTHKDVESLFKMGAYKHEYEKKKGKRWYSVREAYNELPKGSVEKMYVDYLAEVAGKYGKYLFNEYAIPIMQERQNAAIQSFREGGYRARMNELKRTIKAEPKPKKGEKHSEAREQLAEFERTFRELKEAAARGDVHPLFKVEPKENWLHRTWIDDNDLNNNLNMRFAQEIAKVTRQIKDGKKTEADLVELKEQHEKTRSQIFEFSTEVPGEALYAGEVGGQYSLIRNLGILEERSLNLGGYDTFLPRVYAEYIRKASKEINLTRAGVQAVQKKNSFMRGIYKKFGVQVDEFGQPLKYQSEQDQVQIARLSDFWDSYIRDNLGFPTTMTTTPKLSRIPQYLYHKARGTGAVERDPAKYETTGFSDIQLRDKLQRNLKRLGFKKTDLPNDVMARMANLDAKWNLASLLFYPKTWLANKLGGTTNMISVGSFALYRQAGKMIANKEFDQIMTSAGVAPDLLQHELNVTKNVYRTDMGELAKRVAKIWDNPKLSLKQKRRDIHTEARRLGITEKITETAAWFMTNAETSLRRRSFAMGYIQGKEMGLKEDQAMDYGRRFVYATQYLYHNAVRPEFARSGFGKVMTRFMTYMWSTVGLQRQLHSDAKFQSVHKGSTEHKRLERWLWANTVLMMLGALYPFSIFESTTPPHLDYMKDAAELLLGDDDDKRRAFFGTHGFSMVTSPTPSKLLLRPMLTVMNQDWHSYMNREMWTLFPFGRAARGAVKSTFLRPDYAIEITTGIPVHSFWAESGRAKKELRHDTPTYLYPQRRYNKRRIEFLENEEVKKQQRADRRQEIREYDDLLSQVSEAQQI